MRNNYLSLAFIALLLFSCDSFRKNNAATYTLTEIKNEALTAQSEHKLLGLLITIDDCIACDKILSQSDHYFPSDITDQLKIINIQSNFIDNKIFNQLLYAYVFPLLIITDADFNVYGMIAGAKNENNSYQQIVQNSLSGRAEVTFPNSLAIENNDYLDFTKKMFQSQYLYENKQYDELLPILNEINSKKSTFYTLYLQSKTEKRLGMDSLSKISATKSLAFKDRLSELLFYQYRVEMNYLADDFSKVNSKDSSSIAFETTMHHFGELKMGKSYSVTFRYKNIDSLPNAISNATFSCKCIEAQWDKSDISPQKESDFEVNYTPQQLGKFSSIISVKIKDKPQVIPLLIKGTVIK